MDRKRVTFSRNLFIPLTTVCRNNCHYCSFRTGIQEGCLLSKEEVRRLLELGKERSCTEALFTFGEHPEEVPGFLNLLSGLGFQSILDFCIELSKESIRYGILPHTNAGVITYTEMEKLKPYNASMGLMLETTADIPAHTDSPGKNPKIRLRMIEEAGQLRIPFTTGILVGIGETRDDRIQSLLEIANLHRKYNHIQEVIIQNFCPKERTGMQDRTGPEREIMCDTIQLARDILPQDVAVQVAPNLFDPKVLIECGANDLGGISPFTSDHINPEHPWPTEIELLNAIAPVKLQERLCIYPRYIEKGWFSPLIAPLIKELNAKLINEQEVK